jgi:protein SCO1/2/putative membrane protein
VARSYRTGARIVLATVALAAILCVARVDIRSGPPPAGRDLGPDGPALGPFALIDQTGAPFTGATLADRPWIAAFIFTRCPASCPRISAVMRGVQDKLAGTPVGLVSVSVDPERDTPSVLARYARGLGADQSRWHFLTGPKDAVYRLILEGFRVPVSPATPEAVAAGAEDVAHSERLVLVAPGNRVAGYFDANDPPAVAELVARARSLARPAAPAWAKQLPGVNAALNGLATVLLVVGWVLVRTRRVRGHVACMAAALVVSGLFLACYLVYHGTIGGGVPYRGVGPIRLAYFTILLSHVVLAAAIVPLVVLTVARALRKRWDAHARIAGLTLPIWLYVSITGVVVYWMLYRMGTPTTLGGG